MYIEVKKYNGEDMFTADVQRDEEWWQTLTREYNNHIKAGIKQRHVALDNHFQGGGTHHIQMGYNLGGQTTTLDDTIIVWVSPDDA